MFIAFNYKEYGMLEISDDSFLTIVGSCGSVLNGLGRLFWGILFDKFSFRTVSIGINTVLLLFAVSMQFLVKNKVLYLIAVCLVYFAYGGNYSVYPTQTIRIFGSERGAKLYYIVFIGFSLGTCYVIHRY
jgi:OFA family oxalate/formate antiporter-like MFS transporter